MAKVTTWSIATGILYGTIRAVSTLTEELLQLERSMARVATVTRPETGGFGDLQSTIRNMRREVMDFAAQSPEDIQKVAQTPIKKRTHHPPIEHFVKQVQKALTKAL